MAGLLELDRQRHQEAGYAGTRSLVTFLVMRAKTVMVVLFLAGLAATVYMYNHVPTAFVPHEDQGYFLCIVQTPPGASLSYTADVADKASKIILQNKDVFGTFSVMGFSLSGGSSPNAGLIFAPLKPIDDRTKLGKGHTAARYRGRMSRRSCSGCRAGLWLRSSRRRFRVSARWAGSSSCCRTQGGIRLATSTAW